MSDFAAILKRGATSLYPHELVLITDEDDPLYDERVHREIKDAAILDIAANGYGQPALLKPRDGQPIVDDGAQRTKRGLVINALNGSHAYKGPLKSVKDAIERLRGSEIGKAIVGFCPQAIKIPIMVFRGTDAEAYRMKVSANEYRDGDELAVKIRRAQRMSTKLGMSNEEIAISLNVSGQTVGKYLAKDLNRKPSARKARGKSSAPSKAVVRKVLKDGHNGLTPRESTLLSFVGLGAGAAEFAVEFPALAKAMASP